MPLIGALGLGTGILGLAGVLRGLFSGGGGGGGGDPDLDSAASRLTEAQLQALNLIMPQLLASLGLDRQASLRQRFLSDPVLATTISDAELQDLGLDRSTVMRLAEGGVPLQQQVLQGASLLLPRFMQSPDPRAALQAATPQTRVGPDLSPIPTPGVPNPFPDDFWDFLPPAGTPTPTITPSPPGPGQGGPGTPGGPQPNDCTRNNCQPVYGEDGAFLGCDCNGDGEPGDDPTDDPDRQDRT